MLKPKWRIYYETGETYDADPFSAPTRGVQVIVNVEPNVGRMLIAQRDWYWWDVEREFWFGGDFAGMLDYLDSPGPKRVLRGRFVLNAEYQACVKRALNDPDFPAKTARHPEEVF